MRLLGLLMSYQCDPYCVIHIYCNAMNGLICTHMIPYFLLFESRLGPNQPILRGTTRFCRPRHRTKNTPEGIPLSRERMLYIVSRSPLKFIGALDHNMSDVTFVNSNALPRRQYGSYVTRTMLSCTVLYFLLICFSYHWLVNSLC